jgi:xanthine/uracil/vitamin C permease (AzgA family)
VRVELLGGVSTFLTMCYILFINPAILSAAGVPFKAVAVATAVAACVTTAAMALLTNYPFALARTGLSTLVTAAFFALAICFVPIISLVGQSVKYHGGTINPAVAPALIMVGYLMLRLVPGIDWSQPETALPAFLIIAGIPMTFSIAAGIGFGVFGYVAVMLARGRWRRVHPLMYGLVPLFGMYYASGWLSSHVF